MNLLIIDGSNIVMRCAFGGEVPPAESVRVATNMIERAARELQATHLVVALDCPGVPSWRKQLYPDYKGHRTVDTYPWIAAAAEEWLRRQWWVEAVDGFEADDVIATVAMRAMKRTDGAHGVTRPTTDKFAVKVAAAAEVARLSLKLVTLVRDVPVVPIAPSGCRLFNF